MTNTVNQISPTYNLSGAKPQTTTANSSTSEILSSFKDIFSTMMTGGGTPSTEGASSGLGDLMMPLLMIVLLEKLVEGQMEGQAETQTGSQVEQASSPVLNQVSKNEPSGRPVGGVLTQEFHSGHNGLDIGVPVGTEVKTTMDGNVVYAGWNNQGYGNLVIVQNGDYKTYYAHLSSIPVAVGDSVAAGATIGLSGNTGNSTGPHLHYEIRRNNVPIDPTTATLGA
jgi:murein DD-endopeptidase MepM/ murein hydrolase activator NlpD